MVIDNRDRRINVYRSDPDAMGTDPRFEPRYMTVSGTGGKELAVGDFNGDGFPDVVSANQTDLAIRFNQDDGGGDRVFLDGAANVTVLSPGGVPYDVRVADFNNDGMDDIAAIGSGGLTLYFGGLLEDGADVPVELGLAGDESLIDPNADPEGDGAAVGNYDTEGGMDLALLTDAGRVLVLTGIGQDGSAQIEEISLPTGGAPYRYLASGSIEQNSIDDLFVLAPLTGGTPDLRVYKNDGAGSFSEYWDGIPPSATMLLVSDLAIDGYADVFLGTQFIRHSYQGMTYSGEGGQGNITIPISNAIEARAAAIGRLRGRRHPPARRRRSGDEGRRRRRRRARAHLRVR